MNPRAQRRGVLSTTLLLSYYLVVSSNGRYGDPVVVPFWNGVFVPLEVSDEDLDRRNVEPSVRRWCDAHGYGYDSSVATSMRSAAAEAMEARAAQRQRQARGES